MYEQYYTQFPPDYDARMKEMYEEMYHTLLENVLVAQSFLENNAYDAALHRIQQGIQASEGIFLEQNID